MIISLTHYYGKYWDSIKRFSQDPPGSVPFILITKVSKNKKVILINNICNWKSCNILWNGCSIALWLQTGILV